MPSSVICDIKVRLFCPLTNVVSIGLEDMSVYEAADTDGTFKPSNPFYDDPKTENSLLDIALENLQIITCRKGPSMYITVYTHM